MSSMTIISRRLNPNFESYTDCVNFGNVWRRYLMSVPWASARDLSDLLIYENAILLPFYVLHYDNFSIDGTFKFYSHPYPASTTNANVNLGSDLGKIKDLFHSLGLDFSIIEKNSLQLPLEFHSKYYIGHAPQFNDYPAVPECVKHMMDSAVLTAYGLNAPNFRLSGDDWCVQLSFRIDNIFSKNSVQVNLITSMFDNCALTENPPFWPIDQLCAGLSPYSRIDSLLNTYNDKLETLFSGQKTVLRRYLDYTPSSEFEEAQAFLNSDSDLFIKL